MTRSDDIQRELRASAPAAPDQLRTRVQTIVARESTRRRPAFTMRRTSLALVGGLVLAATGAAVVQGLDSGSSGERDAATILHARSAGASSSEAAKDPNRAGAWKQAGKPPAAFEIAGARGTATTALDAPLVAGSAAPTTLRDSTAAKRATAPAATLAPTQLPPAGFRLQNYDVQLGVRVKNSEALSSATVQAMRWTRAYGGFVASVSYDTPGARKGESELVLRVPVGQVQNALQKLSSLGVLTSQHVTIQDLQGTVNTQTKRIITLNRRIGAILTELDGTGLTVDKTARLQAELAARRSELAALTVTKAATVRQGRLAHIYLELRTQAKKQVVVPAKPHKPGTIERQLHSAGHVLAQELAFVLAALVIGAPFILLGAIGVAGARGLRRRSDRRLLDATPS